MNHAPILILQMQRMGDLVLSFPLMELLRRLYPRNPLWVMGESIFFEPLRPISPPAEYFSFDQAQTVLQQKFHAVINLSHRQEAAILAGKAASDMLAGPALDSAERLFIHGDWQLYRASLTHNNRYNLFHWADLNLLDMIPAQLLPQYNWPIPRNLARLPATQRARVGLFIGASEASKHPSPDFWAELANLLLGQGLRPVLLGGAAEARMGAEVAKKINAPALNLCGHFSVYSLSHFIRELALLVVPDTGPMHIAAWMGTPVINLSMGPVNAWETGPAAPGHHVARARLACVGCWQCTRDSLYCHDALQARTIAALIRQRISGDLPGGQVELPGHERMELLKTMRTAEGLYSLKPVMNGTDSSGEEDEQETAAVRNALSHFWQSWFSNIFGLSGDEKLSAAWKKLKHKHPAATASLKTTAAAFAANLARTCKSDPARLLQEPDFWKQSPSLLRPFSGYAQMYAQNAQGSRKAFTHILSLAEKLAEEA